MWKYQIRVASRAGACVSRNLDGQSLVRAPVLIRYFASQQQQRPSDGEQISKEQAELLRLLRESESLDNKKAFSRVPEQSLGLAGVALSQGAASASTRRIDKWTGFGKKWRDLSGGQKAARATVNTSRFFVVSFGALLTFVVGYSLTSELFARNSPTVIYNEACKVIQKSDKVHDHLLEPYRFHTSLAHGDFSPLNLPSHPHNATNSVHSSRFIDPRSGRETMFLHFFIESRDKDKPLGYWQFVRSSIVSGAQWLKTQAIEGGNKAYVWWQEQTREPTDASSDQALAPEPKLPPQPWWITRKLRGAVHGVGEIIGKTSDAVGMSSLDFAAAKPVPGTWTSGEVYIELVKDDKDTFQYKHFTIDIPNSRSPLRRRLHLDQRHDGVPIR